MTIVLYNTLILLDFNAKSDDFINPDIRVFFSNTQLSKFFTNKCTTTALRN